MRRVVLFLVLALLPSFVSAQTPIYRYVAKYVCGKHANPPNNFASGVYSTSINVFSLKAIQFKKRFTVSWPQEKAGGVTPWINTGLPAMNSMQIDCDNILMHVNQANLPTPAAQATEGFVVIESTIRLDVVAVYSAGPQGGPVATLLMERVH